MPDVPGPPGACPISAPAGLELMASTSIILEEAGVSTSPTTPPAPASLARGGLLVLESAIGGVVVLLSPAAGGEMAVRVSSSFGCKERGLNRPLNWARPAGLGRPAQAHPGRVRSPLRSRGSSCIYALSPSTCTILMMSSSRPRWRFSVHEVRSFTLQSSGVFLCNTSVLTTIGSDFIKLMNTVTP
jgi:hypothetical protein